ncbi:MAG: helix-turn-helix transcriptional regulator [Lachnospiraceae bacterium]|nr:helix-turn-helix transcriptional regulator [Lachnospiraceae bacterium]
MISYEPLFRTMKEKSISSYKLQKEGISKGTYSNILNKKGISTHTINKLCTILDCKVEDIIEFTPDE